MQRPPLLLPGSTALHEALSSPVEVLALLLLSGTPDADAAGLQSISRIAFEVASAVLRSQELPVACVIMEPRGQSAALIPAFFETETLPALVVYNKTSHARHAHVTLAHLRHARERDVSVAGEFDEAKVRAVL